MNDHWSKKKVLVTGAGGFIGSHLIERLVDLGADVTGFVRYNSRNDWGLLEIIPQHRLDSLQVVSGDLMDFDAVSSAVKDVDIIFHLGSLISIPYSYNRPRDTIENNILSTLNILTAARDQGWRKWSIHLPARYMAQHYMCLSMRSIPFRASPPTLPARSEQIK